MASSKFVRCGCVRGHTASVCASCVEASGAFLTTCGEDCRVLIHDLEKECVVVEHVFDDDEVPSCVCYNPTKEQVAYVGLASGLCILDRRTEGCRRCELGREEVNCVAAAADGFTLAAADDGGVIHMMDLRTDKVYKRLRKGHSSLCSSVAFCPKRPQVLVSAGLDARVVKWDVSRGRILSSWSMMDESSQVVNPPYVHSLDVPKPHHPGSVQGLVAVARGDGEVSIFSLEEEENVTERFRTECRVGGHEGGVEAISLDGREGGLSAHHQHDPPPKTEETVPVNSVPSRQSLDRLQGQCQGTMGGCTVPGVEGLDFTCSLDIGQAKGTHLAAANSVKFLNCGGGVFVVSGGNDRVLKVWDWVSTHARCQSGQQAGDDVDSSQSYGSNEIFAIRHGKKVNHIGVHGRADQDFIYVSDVSSLVSVYSFRPEGS